MTSPAISEDTNTPHPAYKESAERHRLARRHGMSLAQIDDLCRRVGSGRAALEAALALLSTGGAGEPTRS